jgi:Protein of unknown function (DUF3703)
MNPHQRSAFEQELTLARDHVQARRPAGAMLHLERAHVLGQYEIGPHVLTHAWMLRVAVQRRSLADSIGQALRLVLGAIGSALRRVPVGNTGGSNVNMFRPMQIAPDLAALLRGEPAEAAGGAQARDLSSSP